MGKKGGSTTISTPSAQETAQAQATANKETAIAQAQLNMVNQYTPYGSLEYSQRGTGSDGTPLYSATQTLSPEQQNLLNLQNQAQKTYGETGNAQLEAVKGLLSQPLDYSSLGAAPTFDQNYVNSAYQNIMSRAQPQMDQQRAALEQRLANQGIAAGSAAYNNAIDELNRNANDYSLAAQNQALGQASTLYSNQASARNQAINEMIQQRTQPLNELAALYSGSQVTAPTYVNTPSTGVNATDYVGSQSLATNAQIAAAQAAASQNAAGTSGLFGLLGSGAMAGAYLFSDRRLKRHIRRVGTLDNGLPVYSFQYLGGGPVQIGLMAQDVEKLHPDAVVEIAGYKAVDYGRAVEA